MKRIILILLLCLPMMAGAQTYSEIQTRLNANIWQDGTRFQTNTYRRFYSDTLNSLLNDMLDFTNGGFLPLTLTGNKTVNIDDNSLYISGSSGAMTVSQLFNPAIIQQLTTYEDTEFIYGLYEIDVANGIGKFTVESDGIDIGFEMNTPHSAGDGFGFWQAKGVGIYETDYDSIMTTDRHIPDIGWVKGYVDTAAVAGTSYTFTNGLTESGDTVRLGGLLGENTIIDIDSDTLYLYGQHGSSGAIMFDGQNYVAKYGGTTITRGWMIQYGNDYSSRWGTIDNANLNVPHVGWVVSHVKDRARLGRYNATTAPGVNDDVDEGFDVGSFIVDTTNGDAYICIDPSDGAAVWKKITP